MTTSNTTKATKLTNKFIKDYFSYKRPHTSATEREWINAHILPRISTTEPHFVDGIGNIHIDLRTDNTQPHFIRRSHRHLTPRGWAASSHRGKGWHMRVADPSATNCLGADDGAGVLVLLALIEAVVPAYYIFTRGEERGGIGATYLAEKHPELLRQFDRAIAFDRKGTSSVISHQGYGRCCSDAFADALSDALTDDVLMYAPDETGVYTDTAEFVSFIPECTNISVGYINEHTTKETQDLTHLKALIAHVLTIDWDALPTERDPKVKDKYAYGGGYSNYDYNYNYNYNHNHNFNVTPDSAFAITDYNSEAYGACEAALHHDPDDLIYMMCCVVNPADPDELYEMVWDVPCGEVNVKNCMRALDYAEDDEQTERALLDLYQAVVCDATYN